MVDQAAVRRRNGLRGLTTATALIALDTAFGAASRLLIAPELREWAAIERDVVLIGMGSRFELWDKARHEAHEATVLAAGMPDAMRDMVM